MSTMADLIKLDNKLIWAAVHKVKKPKSIDNQDLYQEAVIKYMDLVAYRKMFNKNKTSKEVNFLIKSIKNHLIKELKKELKKDVECINYNNKNNFPENYNLHLTDNEQFVIENRFIYNNYGYAKIGKIIGFSNVKVKALCNSALSKLELEFSQKRRVV